MKKYTLLFGILLCIPLSLQAQKLDKKRIQIAEAFVKDVFYNSVAANKIATKYMSFAIKPGIQRDTLFENLIYIAQKLNSEAFAKSNGSYTIRPYKEIASLPDVEKFNNADAEKNIYGVLLGDSVQVYLLFDSKKKKKIVSFLTFKKGREDPYMFFAI